MTVKNDFNTDLVRGKNCMCKPPPDPNVETVMWNRKEYRLADRLTSCNPEHPYYDYRLLQNTGFLKKVNYPTSGMVPCLKVPLSHTDCPWNCRATTPGCPTGSLWFSAVNPLSWCEIQPVLRPHAPAGLEGL